MSARLRQFSVLPAALANISGDENAASPSQPDHGSPLLAAPRGDECRGGRRRAVRNRRRGWIVRAGAVPATVPMWSSRSAWLIHLEVWRNVYPEVLAEHHMSARLFRHLLPFLARYADSATGRNCAVSNETIAKAAGCSRRSVTTARAILAVSGFGIEARRGSGAPGKPSHWCRASVWHLISRRPTAAEARFCALPPSKRVPLKTPVGSNSPSEAASASPTDFRLRRRRRPDLDAPRDLHTQRIAGWLASQAIGMEARRGRHVVGQLCTALQSSHLLLEAWSGPMLIQALNADMAARGLAWPDRIEQPGAFLAARLRHLPARPEAGATPAPPAMEEAQRRPVTLTEVGRAAREHVRACIAARRRP
jgi:hypothetical protein